MKVVISWANSRMIMLQRDISACWCINREEKGGGQARVNANEAMLGTNGLMQQTAWETDNVIFWIKQMRPSYW